MNQTQLTETLLRDVTSIVKHASILISNKANHKEMVIFHMLKLAEEETGQARIQLNKISKELCISRPAVTQSIDKLVSRELLVRCSDPTDRRAVYVELTEKGREYFKAETETATDVAKRIIARVGEENTEQFINLLNVFKNAMIEETELMKS